ncbi:hypothetical protein WN944_013115 [Citrus x changshan-huyou]|uniref:Uncharacterized protein n=1 Tax=Citrus x changshan-huyou TaxID=2935761 RepID=A0AAP0QNQ5_9ROSI
MHGGRFERTLPRISRSCEAENDVAALALYCFQYGFEKLYETCDRFAADLHEKESVHRSNVSVVCSSTFLEKPTQSQDSTSTEFCTKLWDTCGDRFLDDAKLQLNTKPVSKYNIETQPPAGVCLEKIGNLERILILLPIASFYLISKVVYGWQMFLMRDLMGFWGLPNPTHF